MNKSGVQLCLVVRIRACPVRCELYITHAKAKGLFKQLYERKEQIERELKERIPDLGLSWERLPRRKSCRIAEYRPADLEMKKTWAELITWFERRAVAFHDVFAPIILNLR